MSCVISRLLSSSNSFMKTFNKSFRVPRLAGMQVPEPDAIILAMAFDCRYGFCFNVPRILKDVA